MVFFPAVTSCASCSYHLATAMPTSCSLTAPTYDAPNLKALLTDAKVTKIFHFARFDVAVLKQYLNVDTFPLYCTKLASRLTRTYTDRHGLKDLVKELLGIEMNKQQQSSDWGAHVLSDAQKQYAAQDVLYLHELKAGSTRCWSAKAAAVLPNLALTLYPRARHSIWRGGPKKMSSHTEYHADDTDRLLQAARRRARLAPILSWAVIALGLGLVAMFLLQAGIFSVFQPKPKPVPVTVEMPEQIVGSFSRIAGFDREKQPYEVTAKKGYQDKEKANLVHLEGLVATFRRSSGQSYEISSNAGLYDSKAKEMDLEGKVEIVEAGRFTAAMEKAHIVMEKKNLVSNVPVVVEMDSGTITANGLQITNDGKNILFLNGVKARFTETAKQGRQYPMIRKLMVSAAILGLMARTAAKRRESALAG